jgi:hypothetical protein
MKSKTNSQLAEIKTLALSTLDQQTAILNLQDFDQCVLRAPIDPFTDEDEIKAHLESIRANCRKQLKLCATLTGKFTLSKWKESPAGKSAQERSAQERSAKAKRKADLKLELDTLLDKLPKPISKVEKHLLREAEKYPHPGARGVLIDIKRMIDEGKIKSGLMYLITGKEARFCIGNKSAGIWPTYTRWIEKNLSDNNFIPIKDFKKQIVNDPLFMCKAHTYIANGIRPECYILDADKLNELWDPHAPENRPEELTLDDFEF